MDNIMKKLQWVPFGTPEHEDLVRKIQKTNNSRDFILCTKGHYDDARSPELEFNTHANHVRVGAAKPFEGNTKVFKSNKFYFVRRDKAECNLHHRQINVGVLITDKHNRVLTLQKVNGYLSLVGGHTDFVRDAYNMTVSSLMYHNLTKELYEEVKFKGELILPTTPTYFITEGQEMWDLFHAWFVYHLEVEDLDDYNFSSGEPKKHRVEIVPLDDILNHKGLPKIKHSLFQAVSMLMNDRNPTQVIVRRPVPTAEFPMYNDPKIDVPKPPEWVIGNKKEK